MVGGGCSETSDLAVLVRGQKGTSDEYFLCFPTCTYSFVVGVLLASVTQHHPHVINVGKSPAVNDLIGRKQYLHQAAKQPKRSNRPPASSFTQPTPIRPPSPRSTPAWP